MLSLLAACGSPSGQQGGPQVQSAARAEGPVPPSSTPRKEQEAAVLRAPRDPAALKGMAAMEVTAALGTPTRLRHDKPAEIWQYVASRCVLHLFLYEEGGVQRVAHAEVRYPRGRSRDPEAQGECLGELFSRPQAS